MDRCFTFVRISAKVQKQTAELQTTRATVFDHGNSGYANVPQC